MNDNNNQNSGHGGGAQEGPSVPMDEEQRAAMEGRVTDAQRDANRVLEEQIAKRQAEEDAKRDAQGGGIRGRFGGGGGGLAARLGGNKA